MPQSPHWNHDGLMAHCQTLPSALCALAARLAPARHERLGKEVA